MTSWEERMATRAKAREMVRDAEAYANDPPVPTHLHGTCVACPCGAEVGVTCVAFGEGYVEPDECPDCGKPVGKQGDTQPWRQVERHTYGCRTRADAPRCDYCGDVTIGGAVYSGGRQYHFGHAPGAQTYDPDDGVWRDREGRAVRGLDA